MVDSEKPQKDKKTKSVGCGFIVLALENIYERWGRVVGARPWIGIVAALIIGLICLSGIRQLKNETRDEKLWVPGNTKAQSHKEFVDEKYPSDIRFQEFSVVSSPMGDDVLTPEAIQLAFDTRQAVLDARGTRTTIYDKEETFEKVEYDNKTIAVPDTKDIDVSKYTEVLTIEAFEGAQYDGKDGICLRQGPFCYRNSILPFFEGANQKPDKKLYATKEAILDTLNKGEANGGKASVFVIDMNQVLGGLEREDGKIVGAKAIKVPFLVNGWNIQTTDVMGEDVDPRSSYYENGVLQAFEKQADIAEKQGLGVVRFTVKSFGEEFESTINRDLTLLQLGIIAIAVYTIIMTSRYKYGCPGIRISLSIGGLAAIGLAIGSTYGLCSYMGLFTSNLTSILPFLLIAIGVDDLFVVVNAFDVAGEKFPNLSIPEQMGHALGHAGSAVTITSLTNFAAFVIGSNTALPALRNFSIFAAFGVLFDFIYQLVLFPAFLALDARKFRGNRCEIACCIKQNKDANCCCMKFDNVGLLRAGLRKLGKALCKWPVKIGVIVVYLGLIAGAIVGCSRIPVEGDFYNFIPVGSYLEDWKDMQQAYFKSTGDTFNLYFRNVDFDKQQPQIEEAITAFSNDKFILKDTVKSWYTDLQEYVADNPAIADKTTTEQLQAWLSDKDPKVKEQAQARTSQTIKFKDNDPAKGIDTAYISATTVFLEKSPDQVDAMVSVRKSLESTELGKGKKDDSEKAFAFNGEFLNYELYKNIGREAVVNIGLAFLMITIVIGVLVFNPLASVFTIVAVLSTVVELVGYIYFWGRTIDNVTVIFVVISLGLAVDYAAHIAHGYLTVSGTPSERVVATLVQSGAGVLNGCISTLLAVIIMSASASFVFQTFFRALLITVLAGIFNGVIFLPVLLTILNPSPQGNATQATDDIVPVTDDAHTKPQAVAEGSTESIVPVLPPVL